MKKLMIFGLALMLSAPALFADNALVMPARVGRFYIAPTFITAGWNFDADGNPVSTPDTSMFNLGFALEYGINSWITAAVQWAPGVNLWSDVDLPGGISGRVTGSADIMLGAKIQVIGPGAPVRNDMFRLAFAPGIMIPAGGRGFSEEGTMVMHPEEGPMFVPNNNARVAPLDRHVFGLGLRSAFDWVPSPFFYLNLFNEVRFFPQKGTFRNLGLEQGGQTLGLLAGSSGTIDIGGLDVNFRYDLTFEIDPTFTHRTQNLIGIETGLPFTYYFTPGFTVSDVPAAATAQFGDLDQGSVHRLTVGPYLTVFFMGWPVPMEFRLQYVIPVWGQNTQARHIFGFQIRTYFRF